MRLCITGTPGVGKTLVAKRLGQALHYKVLNEREFALQEQIGEFDTRNNELVVPLEKLEPRLNKLLEKEKNIIVEGHMLCEIRARFDAVVVLQVRSAERLGYRLEQRGYNAEKIQDNVFCEGIDYCSKQAVKNYKKAHIIEVENSKTIKETMDLIVRELNLKVVI